MTFSHKRGGAGGRAWRGGGRQNTRHNDIQYIDTQHNNAQHNYKNMTLSITTQSNDIQYTDNQHNYKNTTLSITTQSNDIQYIDNQHNYKKLDTQQNDTQHKCKTA
jgi:hypothetical protein